MRSRSRGPRISSARPADQTAQVSTRPSRRRRARVSRRLAPRGLVRTLASFRRDIASCTSGAPSNSRGNCAPAAVDDASGSASSLRPKPCRPAPTPRCGAAGPDRLPVSTRTPVACSRQHDQTGEGARTPTMEKGIGVPSPSARGECILPVQIDHRRWSASPNATRAADRGTARVQRLESDDRTRSAPVLQHRPLRCAQGQGWIASRQRRVLQQRPVEPRRSHPAPHVLFPSGDAGCPRPCHSRTGRARRSLNDPAVYASESGCHRGGNPAAGWSHTRSSRWRDSGDGGSRIEKCCR